MARCLILLAIGLVASLARPLAAHEVKPAVADIGVTADRVEIRLRVVVEPMLAGIDLRGLVDTDDAPEAARYDDLRALEPTALKDTFRDAWPTLRERFRLRAGRVVVPLVLDTVTVEAVADPALPRDSIVGLSADLPPDETPITFGWDGAFGPLIVRQTDAGEDAYADYLTAGADTAPLPRVGGVSESLGAVFVRYVVIGFEHIIPKGLDHILFVVGLFLLSTRWRPLLVQVTAFTAAHTVTLALATLGVVAVDPAIVEPLIALSIAVVAVENIWRRDITAARTVVVFAFGLLHGLGFASVLGDVGLQPARFIGGLIGFNVGVELGQLAVIAACYVTLAVPFGARPWYRARIVIPASLAVAGVGAFWFVERIIG